MPINQTRIAELIQETLTFLASRESATRDHLIEHLERMVEPTPEEAQLSTSGQPDWVVRYVWYTVGTVKAGWITKDGRGVWAITDEGRAALETYPDAASLLAAQDAAYREWEAQNRQPHKRAWLVRGSSVLGANLVPEWLRDGYVSLAGSQLRPIDASIDAEELRSRALEDYAHLKHHELRSKVEEIVAFVSKMDVGHVVLTTHEHHVFVGDVTGDIVYEASEGGRSNLRRTVGWRNPAAPVDYADLPAPLPARLQTGSVVLDLTSDIALIEELANTDGRASTESRPAARHEHLPEPSAEVAGRLFVDNAWLSEVRLLLDERRQLIFYGPPGTGKTYIAQALAADLVGPEQVKLVQFHPAYTYEDFFEGYRPVPGGAEGTIAFELRPGPFRKLVDRAREHPDLAFILIIDEINRANLAKVFGELYFLLEYRDQAVDLLYSSDDEGFTLPPNLYLIGTMNTADRSIALVDSAMRRRFAFVSLEPDEEPTASLLAGWSAHHGLGTTAASLLVRLNRLIDDPDFRIGPAYFMKSTAPDAHSRENLDRIWRSSILPLLQEHHYGTWGSVRRRYELGTLLKAIEEE